MPNEHIEAYLARIGYEGERTATADTLRALQYAHLTSVPYENLDILQGIPLSLEIDDLYDKIVGRRRGGYCFELNALFSWLLREMGFEVCDYFARFLADQTEIPKRRHHVLGVTIPGTGERYLADVGVGSGSPNYPLRLEYAMEQRQGDKSYRFDLDAFLGWVLKERKGEAWRNLYSFTEELQLPVDYHATSFFCEHAPASPFNKQAMVALRTKDGRLTLDGDTFKRFEGDTVATWEESTPQDKEKTLRALFGIAL